jgi:hypothetical protein
MSSLAVKPERVSRAGRPHLTTDSQGIEEFSGGSARRFGGPKSAQNDRPGHAIKKAQLFAANQSFVNGSDKNYGAQDSKDSSNEKRSLRRNFPKQTTDRGCRRNGQAA